MHSRDLDLRDLRKRIDKGLAHASRGEGSDGEKFMRSLIEDLDSKKTRGEARRAVTTKTKPT